MLICDVCESGQLLWREPPREMEVARPTLLPPPVPASDLWMHASAGSSEQTRIMQELKAEAEVLTRLHRDLNSGLAAPDVQAFISAPNA